MKRLQKYYDTDSNLKYISEEINHGDFPFRFIINLMYVEYWSEEMAKHGKYHVSIEAVSPEAAKDELQNVLKSSSLSEAEYNAMSDIEKYDLFGDYGIKATLFQKQGNNVTKLMQEARAKLLEIDLLFGFAMDKQQNALGATGWDFIKGDITRSKHKESENA